MLREKCLVCGSKNMKRIIDLGMQPFADTFISDDFLTLSEHVYPLQCDLCESCGQIQTSCVTNPSDRYSVRDYSYTSANSDFSRSHWRNYGDEVTNEICLSKDQVILEIGSNDGYLLHHLQNKGYNKCLGIDPSPMMAEEAKNRHDVDTIVGLFEKVNVDNTKFGSLVSKCGLIVANNVFNHSNNPNLMVEKVSNLLSDEGYFVYELPYWQTLVKSGHFDQIYHEHVSYFTAFSSYNLLKKHGLTIDKIEIVDYHGGSLRVYAKKGEPIINDKLQHLIDEEHKNNIFKMSCYENYMDRILEHRNLFMKNVYDLKSKGATIIAVGAAAKGNTFLNFYNLDNSVIDYVTDSSRFKQGKFTPLTRIPIQSDEVFRKYNEVYAVILSWNIADKLKGILTKINPKVKFITLEGSLND